jgi:hypothetical protein
MLLRRSHHATFTGKTVAFFGDSIIESYGVSDRLSRRLGCQVLNFGFGGCRWAPVQDAIGLEACKNELSMARLSASIASADFGRPLAAAQELAAKHGRDKRKQMHALSAQDWRRVDYVLISFGTNDWSAACPLGAAGSASPYDVRGAIDLTFERLLGLKPDLEIGVLTPIWRGPDAPGGEQHRCKQAEPAPGRLSARHRGSGPSPAGSGPTASCSGRYKPFQSNDLPV